MKFKYHPTKTIPYKDLDKVFTKSPKYFKYIRLPRKSKKFIDKVRAKHDVFNHCKTLKLSNKVWYLMEFFHPNYKTFLIKCI